MKSLQSPSRLEMVLGSIYLIFQITFLPSVISMLCSPLGLGTTSRNIVYFILNFLAMIGIFHSFLGRSVKLGLKHPFMLLGFSLLGLVLYLAANYLLSLLLQTLGLTVYNVNNQVVMGMVSQSYLTMVICTLVLVPVAEETVFRGILFAGIYRKSHFAAYLVSTLCFCAIHVLPYLGGHPWVVLCVCFVQYIPAGLCLAFAHKATGSILAPMLIHAAINGISLFVLR